MTNEVVLVTRLRTMNKGNQALSDAWLRMLQRAFPQSAVRVLERRPRHLLQYTLRSVARERDPVAAFDKIAMRLARMAPGESQALAITPARIVLDESAPHVARFVEARKRLNLRGRLAMLGRYADEYRHRLSAFQRARLVVINPAGEFFPREPLAALYHVLDAHVARTLGRRTAIVNHTMDITDPTLRRIIPAVYRHLDLVGFRDEKSVTAFRDMGGDLRNVLVTPDLALMTEIGVNGARRNGTVAVAINVPEATASGQLGNWSIVIKGLQRAGLVVALVSNELPADHPFYSTLMRETPGLKLEGAGLDHDRYAEQLAAYDVVVTSRMHTGVLAMIGGAPVVAVEGSSFKITGLFQELGLARAVIAPTAIDWPQRVLAQVTELRNSRPEAAQEARDRIAAARERISMNLIPRLIAAASV